MFPSDFCALPLRSDFEDLDALIRNAESEIDLIPEVRRRTPSFDERSEDALAPLQLEFAERHFRLQRSASAAARSAVRCMLLLGGCPAMT
jgi:hypothetical protein